LPYLLQRLTIALLLLGAVLLPLCAVSGCKSGPKSLPETGAEPSGAEPQPSGGLTSAELAERITENMDMTNWQLADGEALRRFYRWEDEKAADDAVFYMAATNIQADELTLLALPDEAAARAVLPVLERRRAEQKENFAGYLPEQEFLLENAVCVTKGRYALLVVSAQAEEILAAFEAAVE
jgi:hypothetical protein